jgi:hypothetical protein
VIDYLLRPLLNYWMTREGQDFTTPLGSIFGPEAMITKQYAGSGGSTSTVKAGRPRTLGCKTQGHFKARPHCEAAERQNGNRDGDSLWCNA